MSKTTFAARCAAVTIGSVLLVGVAGIAMAAEPGGDQAVDVEVSIAEINQPGVLALSVAGTTTTLTENGSTPTVRQFTGTLPTVTVTDTRTADEIPDDAYWSLVGSSSAFTGSNGQPDISAGHLGWTPRLIDGGEDGLVAEGEQVDTVLDTGDDAVGLVDQELLAMADNSEAIAHEGQWTADANLFLRTDANVAAGDYTAHLTLSLFE